MTLTHVLYIPVVFLVGLAAGFIAGARAVRAEYAKQRSRAKE